MSVSWWMHPLNVFSLNLQTLHWGCQGHHQSRLAVGNTQKRAPDPLVKTNHYEQRQEELSIIWRDCGTSIACRRAWVTDLPYENTNPCTVHSLSFIANPGRILDVLKGLCLSSLLVHLKEDKTSFGMYLFMALLFPCRKTVEQCPS